MDGQSSAVLPFTFSVQLNVDRAEVAIVVVILGFSPYSGYGKWHGLSTSSEPCLQSDTTTSTNHMRRPGFVLITDCNSEVEAISHVVFSSLFYTSRTLFRTDIISAYIAKAIRRVFALSTSHCNLNSIFKYQRLQVIYENTILCLKLNQAATIEKMQIQ